MSDELRVSDEHGELVNLARGIIEEITAVKAAELARELSRDPGTLALAAPDTVTAPVPSSYEPSPVWHATLTDPAYRTHLIGHPANRTHLIDGGRHVQAPLPAPPGEASPARRRRRRRSW